MSTEPRQLSLEDVWCAHPKKPARSKLQPKPSINSEGLSYSGWPDGRIGVGCQPRKKP